MAYFQLSSPGNILFRLISQVMKAKRSRSYKVAISIMNYKIPADTHNVPFIKFKTTVKQKLHAKAGYTLSE